MERKRGEEESFDIRHIRGKNRAQDQALLFRTRHHLCRQDVTPAGSQKLRAQDPAPARRCRTKGRRGNHGREGGNDGKNRDGGGDGNENGYVNEHEGGDEGKNRSKNGDESREEGEGERESGNLRSGNRSGSEDAREGVTPTSNQSPQPQDPTPPRDRHIMRRTRPQGREARDIIGEDGEKAKERQKPQKSYRRDLEYRGDLGGRRKNVGKKVFEVLVQ